jgi:hypothetical protein
MSLAYKHTEHEDEEERHRGDGFELFPNLQAAQIDDEDEHGCAAAPPGRRSNQISTTLH